MDKMLTFEEWDNETLVRNIATFDENQRRACFNAARQGMIPESEAVRIPAESVPSKADSYCVIFGRRDEGWEDVTEQYDPSWIIGPNDIPRPTPKWVPQVGEAVFAYNGGDPWIARIIDPPEDEPRYPDDVLYVVCSDGQKAWWRISNLKPFDATKIGKPWDEI